MNFGGQTQKAASSDFEKNVELTDQSKHTLETESNDAKTRPAFCKNNFMHDSNRILMCVCVSVYFNCIKIANTNLFRNFLFFHSTTFS